MHPVAAPRKTSGRTTIHAQGPALAFAAVVVANVTLAFGPWFVRMADTGPVAAAFWRITLAAPILLGAAIVGMRGNVASLRGDGRLLMLVVLGGLAFAADLGSWHIGILRTTLANATLFGNSATLIFPLYGFLVARAWPTRIQGMALVLAAGGAALLMGQSYQMDPRHLAGDLFCVAAGILYTVYFIAMARARTRLGALPALALSTIASIAPLLLLAVMLGERLAPTDWRPLVGLALVSQIVGQGCMIYALGKLSPLIIGLALLIQPSVAATIGWIVYGEQLGTGDLLGIVMVAAALVMVRVGGSGPISTEEEFE